MERAQQRSKETEVALLSGFVVLKKRPEMSPNNTIVIKNRNKNDLQEHSSFLLRELSPVQAEIFSFAFSWVAHFASKLVTSRIVSPNCFQRQCVSDLWDINVLGPVLPISSLSFYFQLFIPNDDYNLPWTP